MVQWRCESWNMIYVKCSILPAAIICVLLNSNCSLIPLQAGRIDVVLNFRQTYELGHLQIKDPSGLQFGPRLLMAALGRQNYCSLPESVRTEYQSGLMTGGNDRWIVDGLATAIVSPSPWSTDGFVFEAHGRYLIRDFTKVIATSDFYIGRQSVTDVRNLFRNDPRHEGKEGNLHWIDLLIHQIIIREVDLRPNTVDKRFVHESSAVLRIYLMPLNSDGVFMIAPVKHEIGIISSRDQGKVYSVGCVRFLDLANRPIVFDVRKRDSMFRTKDYPKLLRRADIHEHSESFSPQWYGQSCASDEQRPAYRAGSEQSAREWTPDPEGKILERLFDAVDDSTCNTPPSTACWQW